MKRVVFFRLVCLVAVAATLVVPAASQDVHGRYTIAHDYRPSSSLTKTGWLSDYYPALLGTPGDSKVYYFEGKKPGGTLFVGGGTHPNEIAGIMAAVVFLENLALEAGRVIVVPNLNNSAVSHLDTEPEQPAFTTRGPDWIRLDSPSGTRFFKYGSRCTHPAHQLVADPESGYVHPDSSEDPLPAWEFRNLNRAYPGRTDSGLTQKIAYAVMMLLKKEKVTIAFDYHEADMGGRLANMVVAHPKNISYAASAVMDIEFDHGLELKLEPSNLEFRGLSHREWGSGSDALSFLTESPHPGMSADATDETDVVNDPRSTLGTRVALHVTVTESVVRAYNEANPKLAIRFSGLPSYEDLVERGVGPFLQ
ncbi:MAG: succinylglutamate desuccinylase/aspartoacylase family protein [Spirochaetales bacterium]|nr:succinylglutamate desuccinylase/aspartoacylase family protein [Spirochaetales bacterium]